MSTTVAPWPREAAKVSAISSPVIDGVGAQCSGATGPRRTSCATSLAFSFPAFIAKRVPKIFTPAAFMAATVVRVKVPMFSTFAISVACQASANSSGILSPEMSQKLVETTFSHKSSSCSSPAL